VFTVDIDSASSFYCKKTGGYNIYMNSGRFCLPRSGFVQQRAGVGPGKAGTFFKALAGNNLEIFKPALGSCFPAPQLHVRHEDFEK